MGTWLFCLIAGGMLSVLAMCRPEQIAWKFVRLIGVLSLALLVGAGAWFLQSHFENAGTIEKVGAGLTLLAGLPAAVLIGLAPVVSRHRFVFVVCTGLAGAAGMAAGCCWTAALESSTTISAGHVAAIVAGQATGALLMGSVTVAWLLGHAYLTATKMTIAPLRRLARILLAAVLLRCAFALCSMGLAWAGVSHEAVVSGLIQSWLIVSMRAALGLLLPAVFAYMVLDCVKLRATQSATGILYFTSLFVYVGELSSQHLLAELGWPI